FLSVNRPLHPWLSALSLHDALPILGVGAGHDRADHRGRPLARASGTRGTSNHNGDDPRLPAARVAAGRLPAVVGGDDGGDRHPPRRLPVHGVNWKSAAAMGGSLVAVAIATALAGLAIDSTSLRGLGDESNLQILLYLPELDITGLMLAGMIIGALGVLNDATIAQASTITELKRAEPDASPWQLFRNAMRVGEDHIASMVYTLVLGYAGV